MSKRKPRPLVDGFVFAGDGFTRITVPVRVVSEANTRDHWRDRNDRKKHQQLVVGQWLKQAPKPSGVRYVYLRRHGARHLDGDNLQGAFKGVRDCVAKWLGIDDGDASVTWEYGQHIGTHDGIEIDVNREVVS